MKDRAMQALHLLALEPVAETTADNSYGFRPKRSTADAIGQCFLVLGKKAQRDVGAGRRHSRLFRQHQPRMDAPPHSHGQGSAAKNG
jgi:hypothetical protein